MKRSKQAGGSSGVFNSEKKVKGDVISVHGTRSTHSQEMRGSFDFQKMGKEKRSNPAAARSASLSPLPLMYNFVWKFPRPRHNLLAQPGYTCDVPSPRRTT